MMLVCQDRACGYRENVSKNTNVRCPECHVKLEIRGKGDGAIYFCKRCGFREKVSSFNKNILTAIEKTVNAKLKIICAK